MLFMYVHVGGGASSCGAMTSLRRLRASQISMFVTRDGSANFGVCQSLSVRTKCEKPSGGGAELLGHT